MPATINIWDTSEMSTCAQTGGVWTYTGSIAPAPTPPVTYNGDADFTGITTAGDYEFTYTVGTATSVHTVSYGSTVARVNNTCAAAKAIAVPTPGPDFDVIYPDYNDSRCPGYAPPGNSGESYPSNWVYNATYLDQWYFFDLPAMTCNVSVILTVDGSNYQNEGIEGPAVALYTAPLGGACGDKVIATSIEESQVQEAVTVLLIPPYEGKRIFVRMASEIAGKFDITIQAQPLSQNCTPVDPDTDANVWGFSKDYVLGYDDGPSVWGY